MRKNVIMKHKRRSVAIFADFMGFITLGTDAKPPLVFSHTQPKNHAMHSHDSEVIFFPSVT